jgi:hypothetical protein
MTLSLDLDLFSVSLKKLVWGTRTSSIATETMKVPLCFDEL